MEGPDGSGTSKHSSLLANRLILNGYDVILTAEPTDGSIGATIRTLLKGEKTLSPETLQLLFCADRAEHVNKIIQPALNSGKIVISDRYSLSTIVYGSALGIDEKWLSSVNNYFIKPDLTFITLPPFEVGMERIHRRPENDHFENVPFQKIVYEEYAKHSSEKSIIVDTSGGKEDVAKEVTNHVLKSFPDLYLPKDLKDY
ncbi:MAG: dTMP kinase [Candidatus Peribacteraceae bacterium]|nr:dTMP kinase [Candidatus Peribacteraceae bacterium]